MVLKNKVYDLLKWMTLILIPAISVLYLAMANIWGLPYGTEVVATLAAIDLFLAAILGISTNTFKVMNPMYRINLVKLSGNAANWIVSSELYEVLTWITQILLPALSVLYGALAAVWALPYPDQIVGTIMAIDAFLGMLLGFSTAQFHKSIAFNYVENSEKKL